MTTDDILALCAQEKPAIIYLSIGCSQAHHPPTSQQIQQEYPNFLHDIPGAQICILIDPLLEAPPVAFQACSEDPSGITRIGRVSYITLRRYFDWKNELPFIERLCMLSMHTPTRLIVQDYSGEYIHNHYPIALGPVLLKQVLFDKVKLLVRPDGSFVQPRYEPIATIVDYVNQEQLQAIVKDRQLIVATYVRRLYRIQNGQEEYRDWCTSDVVLRRMSSLRVVYDTLVRIMLAYMWDLCETVHDYISEADALAMISRPTAEYEDVLKLLISVLV